MTGWMWSGEESEGRERESSGWENFTGGSAFGNSGGTCRLPGGGAVQNRSRGRESQCKIFVKPRTERRGFTLWRNINAGVAVDCRGDRSCPPVDGRAGTGMKRDRERNEERAIGSAGKSHSYRSSLSPRSRRLITAHTHRRGRRKLTWSLGLRRVALRPAGPAGRADAHSLSMCLQPRTGCCVGMKG
jgi:hypothetical protein